MQKADFEYKIEKHEDFFYSQLSERGKRQYAGLEAMKLGYNGVKTVSKRFGLHHHTVRKGKQELLKREIPPVGKSRKKGGGRKKNAYNKRAD
jgi:hypothetical protein